MLWEVELRPLGRDRERERVCTEFDAFTGSTRGRDIIASAACGYLLQGRLEEIDVQELAADLLYDPLDERLTIRPLGSVVPARYWTVTYKPGVMDPASDSIVATSLELKYHLEEVRSFRRYFIAEEPTAAEREVLFSRVLANAAIEQLTVGPMPVQPLNVGLPYHFRLVIVPLLEADDAELIRISRDGGLALTIEEMRTIQVQFRELGREPSDAELESIAQTWSEHCSHKTLKGTIDYAATKQGTTTTKRYGNLLKETIFGATVSIRTSLGPADWCVSVFSDNAGIIKFDETNHLCFKVETHNRPSAIEPYGGANTGLGGVIRDVIGTGLGGKPICNTDVFCFAPPDTPAESLPPGVLHPRQVMQGVVAGVRDYGNRMGIPTVNGAIVFDARYLANPLVFCGTVGLIPVGMEHKQVHAGDLIVALGGRTGRDGIHGATFSSLELTDKSAVVSGGAVQIGNAIEEKKVLDVILQARDRRLYTAITDCGAGGFSSAVGEMGADLGASVELSHAPLKYAGLSYTEIWISESQERMVLSVPPANWEELETLCRSEGVDAVVLGTFEATGKLKLSYRGEAVAEVSMHFLHDGRPNIVRKATYTVREPQPLQVASPKSPLESLKAILGSYSTCSKEWVIRQYDHEVQGGSVVKPLVGLNEDGPSDAAVIRPLPLSNLGAAIGCGLNPQFADLDPYAAAACAIDEAVRNVVAVGADPAFVAILDNFCWGNIVDEELLGALVRTAEACRDVAIAYSTPFISGKDSLNNEYKSPTQRITIPGTLLISALGRVPDVTKCTTMDLKAPGNRLYLIGETKSELGASAYTQVNTGSGGAVPMPNVTQAPAIFRAVHAANRAGLLRSCHDLSEGGLAVAIAEMAFAGGIGADVTDLSATGSPTLSDVERCFSESPTRFLVEVESSHTDALTALFAGLPLTGIGVTTKEKRLRIAGADREWLIWATLDDLKECWQRPLRR